MLIYSSTKINTIFRLCTLLVLLFFIPQTSYAQPEFWRGGGPPFTRIPESLSIEVDGVSPLEMIWFYRDRSTKPNRILELWQFNESRADSNLVWELNRPIVKFYDGFGEYLIGDFNLNGHVDIALRGYGDPVAWSAPVVIFEMKQNSEGTIEVYELFQTNPSGYGTFKDLDKDGTLELISLDGCGDEHNWTFVDAIFLPVAGQLLLANTQFDGYFDAKIHQMADSLLSWTHQWEMTNSGNAWENIADRSPALMHLAASRLDSTAVELWHDRLVPVFLEVICSLEYAGWRGTVSKEYAISWLRREKQRALNRLNRLRSIIHRHQ